MVPRPRFVLLLPLFVACHGDVGVGTTGTSGGVSLSGTVSSALLGPIPHAQVVATDSANPGQADTARTDSAGHFAFPTLNPGPKTVTVSAPSLPSGCFPPLSTHTTVATSRTATLTLSLACVKVAGTYAGYATLVVGGAGAVLDSTLVAYGLGAYFPDSASFTATVSQTGDTVFGIDASYLAGDYTGTLSAGPVIITGPVVVGQLALAIPSVTIVPGLPPVIPAIIATTTCQASGPESFTMTLDSTGTGQLAAIAGDAGYSCTTTITGFAPLVSTLQFHLAIARTGP